MTTRGPAMTEPRLRDYRDFEPHPHPFIRLTPREVRAALAGTLTVLYRLVGGLPPRPQNVRYLGAYLKCDAPPGSGEVSVRAPCVFDAPRLWGREDALVAPPGFAAPSDPAGPWAAARDEAGRTRSVGYAAEWSNPGAAARRLGVPLLRAKALPSWASRLSLVVDRVHPVPVQSVTEAEALAMNAPDAFELIPGLSREQNITTGERATAAPHRAGFAIDWDDRWGDAAHLFWKANPYAWRIALSAVEVRRG